MLAEASDVIGEMIPHHIDTGNMTGATDPHRTECAAGMDTHHLLSIALDAEARRLAGMLATNFKKYAEGVDDAVVARDPRV